MMVAWTRAGMQNITRDDQMNEGGPIKGKKANLRIDYVLLQYTFPPSGPQSSKKPLVDLSPQVCYIYQILS